MLIKIILVMFFIYYFPMSFANCEMVSRGFHTIATYLENEKSLQPEQTLLPYYLNGNVIEFSNLSVENHYPKLLSAKYLELGKKRCEIEKKLKLSLLPTTQNMKILIPSCFTKEELASVKVEGRSLFDNKTLSFRLPVLTNTVPVNDQFSEKDKIEENIRENLKSKYFQVSDLVLSSKEYHIKKFNHHKFLNSNMFTTLVTASSTKKEHNNELDFYIVFLSLNGKSWYIADSAYEDPCNSGPHTAKFNEQTGEKKWNKDIGWISDIKTGWIYGDTDYPQIIQFSNVDVIYFLNFNHQLVVIEHQMSNWFQMNERLGDGLNPEKK